MSSEVKANYEDLHELDKFVLELKESLVAVSNEMGDKIKDKYDSERVFCVMRSSAYSFLMEILLHEYNCVYDHNKEKYLQYVQYELNSFTDKLLCIHEKKDSNTH